MKEKRNLTVDSVKGFAIILVVLGHSLNNAIDSPYLTEVPVWISALKEIIYSFHMQLFFFISGVFSYRSAKKGIKTAALDKVRRLLIPYFIWAVLSSLVKIVFASYQNNPRDISAIIFSWYAPVGIYWFIYVLFFISLFYILIVAVFKTEKTSNIVFLVISAALFIFGFCLDMFPDGAWILYTLSRFQIWFAIGLFTPKLFAAADEKITVKLPILYKPGEKSMDIYCLHQFAAGAFRIVFLKLLGTAYISARVITVFILALLISYFIAVSPLSKMKIYRISMGYK